MTPTMLRDLAWIAVADAEKASGDDRDHLLALSDRLVAEAKRLEQSNDKEAA